MKTKVDPQLREEATRFRLLFTCPDCIHFDEEAQAGRGECSQSYPSEEHRDAQLGSATTSFCKLFEAG